ncbi:hypothetical protein JTB14_030843 [Gonioctena quinquepunctata]|nr:hypothetical protein JTB14_030843 [Gonioctena quinquepunctata]
MNEFIKFILFLVSYIVLWSDELIIEPIFARMWFEILPAFGIIVAAMAAPHVLAYAINYIPNENCYRRLMETREQRLQYLRDRRLTGDPYVVAGLEKIADECEDVEKYEECEVAEKEEKCEVAKKEECEDAKKVEQCEDAKKVEQCDDAKKVEQCEDAKKVERSENAKKEEECEVEEKGEECEDECYEMVEKDECNIE